MCLREGGGSQLHLDLVHFRYICIYICVCVCVCVCVCGWWEGDVPRDDSLHLKSTIVPGTKRPPQPRDGCTQGK